MSFRTRLFVCIVATVMTVLGIVMAVAWTRVVDLEVARLNDGLCSEASRVAREHFPANELTELEADIVRKLRVGADRNVLIRYENSALAASFQSSRWNSAVLPDAAAWKPFALQTPSPSLGEHDSSFGAPQGRCALAALQWEGQAWQVARMVERQSTGWVAANLEAPAAAIRKELLEGMQTVVPIAVFLAGLSAWLASGYLVRPVHRLRDSMKNVTPADLGLRLNLVGEDREFLELVASYNMMLARLERSFHQASRFSAEAAHELKTPLTILLGRIEGLRRTVTDPELHEKLSQLLDEVSRLASITRKLLLLSRADAGKLELNTAEVDLSAMLNELMADARMAGESKLVRSAIADDLKVRGDPTLLRQLLNNIIGNALRYGDATGSVEVSAQRMNGQIRIDVFNTCPAIPMPHRERFFERFYRGADAQSRGLEGSGLGLSLAQEIAQAHQGSVTLAPSGPTEVLLVVNLPAL